MAKLWDKDYTLDRSIERFTVGNDYLLDENLVIADCVASIAHAQMLVAIGVLSEHEAAALKRELVAIIRQSARGEYKIDAADEDCHTSIENRLTAVLGEAGKRIHTGRSRNDQVIAALRLYARDFLLQFKQACLNLARTLVGFAEGHSQVPMPGRTHMQIAMPSSVGLWAGAFSEQLLDDTLLLDTAYYVNNTCPLGSAASYGVPLALDRELVARLLGFREVQNNVLYVNNSRGKTEAVIIDAVEQVMITLSKLAQDMILFSMPEFGYFRLASEVCTGSSIMPQKKNPALLELVRARASTVAACGNQVKGIIRGAPSGYNQDFQETKAAFMNAVQIGIESVHVMDLAVRRTVVDEECLLAGFKPEIFATDYALKLVGGGKPFRDAYREVARDLDKLSSLDPYEALKQKQHTGTTGNLGLHLASKRIAGARDAANQEQQRVNTILQELVGFEVPAYKRK